MTLAVVLVGFAVLAWLLICDFADGGFYGDPGVREHGRIERTREWWRVLQREVERERAEGRR